MRLDLAACSSGSVVVTRGSFQIYDAAGHAVVRPETTSSAADQMVDKDGHRHFMAKEIHQQPEVVGHTLSRYIDPATETVALPAGGFDFAKLDRLTISACGTAYYAGLISKYWFEAWAHLPVEIDIASELRYRDVPYPKNGGALFVSQSGETADTLAALRLAKAAGFDYIAFKPVLERQADGADQQKEGGHHDHERGHQFKGGVGHASCLIRSRRRG
ncbi:MAG: SIS domain-containing protein [Sphingomonadales bacterium]|nr:SIS domain-containing protein [Sphingomonadales bacterium]